MNDKDLSLNQRRVLALFDGENHVSTNDVVNALGLARPTAKQILTRLKEHDLLESRGLGRGAFYTIKQESDILDTKGDKMVIVYRGMEAFRAMFDRLLRTLKLDDFYWSFAFKDEYQSKEVGDLLERFHSQLTKNGVEDRAIASKEVESVLRSNYAKVPGLKLRFTDLNIPIGTIILKDSVINLVWGEKPIAIVIKVPAIHGQYYRSFLSAWDEIGEQDDPKNPIIEKPGNTPLIPVKNFFGVKSLWVKDEVQNPTHTFKDRLAYEMVRPMAEEFYSGVMPSPKTFASISYGNTAKSMGTYVSALNKLVGKRVAKAIAFIPPSLEKKTFGPDTEGRTMSAEHVVENLKKDCAILPIDLEKKIYRSKDLENLAVEHSAVFGEFIDITEGLDRPAYVNIIIEAIEQQLKYSPDYMIVPFGAGILCNEIIDYINDHKLHTKVIPVSSGKPDTIAVMLYGPIWVDTKSLAKNKWGWTRHEETDKKGRKREPYKVYHVEEEELLAAMKELKKRGLHAEPSGASGFAVLPRLSQIEPTFDPKKHSVVVINTGDSFLNYD
jgi:threonine dehydratase